MENNSETVTRVTRNSQRRGLSDYTSPYAQQSLRPSKSSKDKVTAVPHSDKNRLLDSSLSRRSRAMQVSLLDVEADISPVTVDQLNDALDRHFERVSSLLNTKTNEIMQQIGRMELDILDMNDRLTCPENSESRDSEVRSELLSEVVHEIQDRSRRSRNVILHGFAELNDNTLSEFDNNNNFLRDSLHLPTAVYVSRIGKKSESKTRPLKLCFSSSDEVRSFFKNRKLFSDNSLKITNDLTLYEREFLSNLRNKLSERIASGERNLTIKYMDGIPKIVQSKNM